MDDKVRASADGAADGPPAAQQLAAEAIALLTARGLTVAAAESLTGGMLAAALTGIPGASAAFRGGVVAYATDLKASLLGVPAALLARHGAVHPDVAVAMADGARHQLAATVGVATTGVAGPDPADGQPVGTVHIAVSAEGRPVTRALALTGGRHEIRVATVEHALGLLVWFLREEIPRLHRYIGKHAPMPSPARSMWPGTVEESGARLREGSAAMVLLRHLLGDALRQLRLRQGRTLREVSAAARVSLGYLSEVERGQKEASSELLASICGALGAPLSHVLREVSDNFALAELQSEPVFAGVREPSPDVPAGPGTSDGAGSKQPVSPSASHRMVAPAGTRMPVPAGTRAPLPAGTSMPVPAGQRLVVPARQKLGSHSAASLISPQEPLLDTAALPVGQPAYDQVARTGLDITNMVPV